MKTEKENPLAWAGKKGDGGSLLGYQVSKIKQNTEIQRKSHILVEEIHQILGESMS